MLKNLPEGDAAALDLCQQEMLLWLKGALHSQKPAGFEAHVDAFYAKAFQCFTFRQVSS